MESANKQKELLKDRIVYDKDIFGTNNCYEKVLNQLLDDSKHIALSIRFPFQDYSNLSLPKKYENWQIRCCVELYNTIGKENIKSYSENGIQWTKDGTNISKDLKEEIVPMVGVINESNQ